VSATADLRDVLRGALDAAEAAPPVQALEAVTRVLGAALGTSAISFLIADLSGRGLVRLTHHSDSHAAGSEDGVVGVPLEGAVDRALRAQEVVVVGPDEPGAPTGAPGPWVVLAPVTERGEVLGLLELSLPDEPLADVLEEVGRAGHLLGFVVIANRRHTDLFEWSQRSTPFTLSADIQRRLLPPASTCEGGAFTLAAWLEPAASIGGDTFDYSVARDALHLSVTDAMGHGVASALTATLCVGSLRNTRRRGGSLLDQADAANTALAEHGTGSAAPGFATGLLGRLDLTTGVLDLVNAGHVAPLLLRGGAVQVLDLPVSLPFGMFADATYRGAQVALAPGDRLVLLTDGMLERNAEHLDVRTALVGSVGLHPREATRALADALMEATGHELADDATLLVLDWHGGHGEPWRTVGGAEQQRASAPR